VSLGLLVLPNRFHHLLTTLPTDAPVTYPLATGLAAAACMALALGVGVGWLGLVRRAGPGAFAWLGALATWLPTSGLLPTGSGVALRFLLLPTAFVACAVARALAALVRARPRLWPLAAGAAALGIAAETATTLRRIPAWRDNQAFYASVLAESPECYTALFGLASALEELPQPDRVRSRVLLRRAIEIAPEATHGLEARVNLGASYLRAGQLDEALAAYDGAIAVAPDRFEPYLHRAELHQRAGRKALALADLERALERNPALPEADQIRAAIGKAN
jgi:tetratricopeptide (TPR) repeat protein